MKPLSFGVAYRHVHFPSIPDLRSLTFPRTAGVDGDPGTPHIGGTSPSLPTSTKAASIEPSSCFGPRAMIAAPGLRSV